MKQGLYIQRFRATRLQNSFKYQKVKIRNLIPEDLQNCRLIDLR